MAEGCGRGGYCSILRAVRWWVRERDRGGELELGGGGEFVLLRIAG